MTAKHTPDDFTPLHFGYEDEGPNCLIGSHGMFFAGVQQTPEHNAIQFARLFAAAPALLAALRRAVDLYGQPGGPWNVPSEPGSWLAQAREALALVEQTQTKGSEA